MNDVSTKEKILETSHKLFAEKGFNGVSVREIAKESEVNVAAINYHFTNKENLYIETIKTSMEMTEFELKNIYENLDDKSIENYAEAIFDFFKANSEDLKTAFKLVISSDKYHSSLGEDETLFKGPPGGEFVAASLRTEFPKTKEEDIQWAVRTIFTQIVHKAMMSCNHSLCEYLKSIGGDEDVLKMDVLRLVRVVKTDL